MHLIPTIPGGWNPNGDGVFHIQQSTGDIVFLSAADTEIHSLNNAYRELHQTHSQLPSLRIANLVYLKQELTIDKYVEEVISLAKLVICRLLGGRNYYPYLFESISIACEQNNIPVLFLPGYDAPDVELLNSSTVEVTIADTLWKYCCAGGMHNLKNGLAYLFHHLFKLSIPYAAPQKIADLFLFHPAQGVIPADNYTADVAILVYQTHYLADNLAPVYYLVTALEAKGLQPVIAFVSNLRDQHSLQELESLLKGKIKVLINTTSFSVKSIDKEESFLFDHLDVPVIQAIFAACTKEVWEQNLFGLTPVDVAMNIALPEIDGRIITTAVSFKSAIGKDALTDSDILQYSTHEEGCDFVVNFAHNWIRLKQKEQEQKRIALIMPNYPNKDSRLANGVGLDTPASIVEILQALKTAGYNTGDYIPATSDEVINLITHYVTNDPDTTLYRPYQISIEKAQFDQYFDHLSPELRNKVLSQWGPSPSQEEDLIIPGCLLGNIFVSIQPARGYNQDEKAIYHSPDLAPTYRYLAYYCWVNEVFKADAIIHCGKHGNLEWLPGKSVALSKESCFPAALLSPVPHFYPFIVNDPGEGTQAKRRTHAIIIDHLIPPMTRAENYGTLTKLEHLIDEYYEASSVDPKRTAVIRAQITALVKEANLETDLQAAVSDMDTLLLKLDGYLCELKEAQIRDGLHILGRAPEHEQLIDLLIALHRVPVAGQKGITQVAAEELGLGFDPLAGDYETAFTHENPLFIKCRNRGDVVEVLELLIKDRLTALAIPAGNAKQDTLSNNLNITADLPSTTAYCQHILTHTLPKILGTSAEITNLLHGLDAGYVPSGSSGAPTRGRMDVLPTGRNFYSVDVRAIPTQAAYSLGLKSANLIIDRYMQEHGDYPESIGLSVWGTSTMRTGGDDIAQALALMGVQPVWQAANRRVSDFEIIPLIQLRRPRIDVMLRISGFFRDAFPDVISLLNAVVEKVALLDESPEQNPIRKRYLAEKQEWINKGLDETRAHKRSLFRVFGSKPGAYGAGLQAVIDEKNWQTREDLAKIYINWSGYAYGADRTGESAHEVFEKRLADLQIVMHNQDNREHDILDSDDYYQFQGGLANAVENIKGAQPAIYFGDHARPETPRIKSLKEELLKVYRSRVVNPKWIAGVKRHGYKGAFEMAATMDYLFAYDATTNMIDDFMYEGISQEYLFNEENRQFIEQVNPWALKDMTERMLEAIQRGMWQAPKPETLEKLQSMFVDME
ncbi:cobaltochelatase subunit CobN [Chitinophaga sancti]|uniref:Cobaltochelatase CobN n=1 Tax=Chitinophaga sancti TaxID=1004 RepID=A0A1K1NIK9_9BACT|nr:cobaltochelatase subunit CobN [Chitinophaga sancti]WQD63197.1 cobaltochelatase subunit CobN [Chitinophaga sancti]WQG91177.1 cobaltochelatase subunit CobN [Chitinophaga sancti]SFW35097.1 cobaltochelatase CobN [Chitinophaga sancti]